MIRTTPLLLTAALGLIMSAIPLTVQAQNKITSLPYTIKNPGVYVLTKELTYQPQEGTAITITCGNVLLDFKGHTITNPFTSYLNSSSAVSASGMGNVAIRNGKISGFANGIGSVDTVTNMTLSNQLSIGIGGGTAVINCSVLDTGGTTKF